ncbi:MAG: hypothetical protein O2960_02455 [Verrucomicrobia bacterium]|nr:hypothetical protein [Verrucomicrobiota bacterium]
MKTLRLSAAKSVFFLLAGFVSLIVSATAQPTVLWEAYNDHRPSELTHPNVTGYDLRVLDDGGTLVNFKTGTLLNATVFVISESSPDDFGANSPVNAGSPADLLFSGKVDIGNSGLPGLRNSTDVSLVLLFEGLDPTKRYNFRGTVSRGGGYVDRWAVFTLLGADAFVDAHVDGSNNQNIFTETTFDASSLEPNQVALNGGDNKVGSLVGWDNIEPGPDGSFEIEARQYVGKAPFGNPAGGPYGYGFNAIYLAEIQSSGNLRITENPSSQIIPAGQTATLTVVASSPQSIQYQWQKAAPGSSTFANIAGATQASYTTPALTVADDGSKFRSSISSGGNSTISGDATINVDGTIPSIIAVRGSINFNAVHLEFSEAIKLSALANTANYTISGGLTINSAVAQSATSVRILTSKQNPGDRYTITVNNLDDLAGNKIPAGTSRGFTAFTEQPGVVGLEVWNNTAAGNTNPDALQTDARYPDSPDEEYITATFDSGLAFPNGPKNTYGARFRGWLTPAETADYEFFIQSDGGSELHVGASADFTPLYDVDRFPDAIAVTGSLFQEPGFDESVSFPINLKAGQKYAIMAIWKEDNGADYFQLAWKKANDFSPADQLKPIPSQFFSFYGPGPEPLVEPKITKITLIGGKVTIEWTGTTLQSSSDLKNWADEAAAASPLSITPAGAKFYRVKN